MTTEDRTILLGHAADLEAGHHGLPGVSKLIRKLLLELDSANETIAVLRTPPVGTGGTE